jgi:hypothetical protein
VPERARTGSEISEITRPPAWPAARQRQPLAFAATVFTVPRLQMTFGTALPEPAMLAILVAFPLLGWAPDELCRAVLRRTGRQ